MSDNEPRLSFASTHENLTHCSDCGRPFTAPVAEESALEHFPSLDVASYSCSDCAEDFADGGMSRLGGP